LWDDNQSSYPRRMFPKSWRSTFQSSSSSIRWYIFSGIPVSIKFENTVLGFLLSSVINYALETWLLWKATCRTRWINPPWYRRTRVARRTRPFRQQRPQQHKFSDLAQYLVLNSCCRSHQVPEFVLLHNPRNLNLKWRAPWQMWYRQPGRRGCIVCCLPMQKISFRNTTAARITAPGPVFSAQIVLSIPPSSGICAATQAE